MMATHTIGWLHTPLHMDTAVVRACGVAAGCANAVGAVGVIAGVAVCALTIRTGAHDSPSPQPLQLSPSAMAFRMDLRTSLMSHPAAARAFSPAQTF